MMGQIRISKYHGAGNDFVMIDGIHSEVEISGEQIQRLCHRHFGIGADGLIILRPSSLADFKMEYYNSDGGRATMCGNGARCAVSFADDRGSWGVYNAFEADDGLHSGAIIQKTGSLFTVQISLFADDEIREVDKDSFFINTGVPHYVKFIHNLDEFDVLSEGRKIRNAKQFFPDGTNVNFIQLDLLKRELSIRTYERGVEDETLACGTGVTASALAVHYSLGWSFPITIFAKGGELIVDRGYKNEFFLKGPAQFVFSTEITIP